jgi:hypothetical protein
MCVQDIEAEHQEKKTKQESEETKAQAFKLLAPSSSPAPCLTDT